MDRPECSKLIRKTCLTGRLPLKTCFLTIFTSSATCRLRLTLRTLTMLLLMMIIITPWSSPSWEVNRSSCSQEIPHNLWNKQVCHPIHKSPQPFPILSQTNPVHAPSHFLEVHFNILPSTTRSSILSLSFGIPQQNCTMCLINNVKNYRFTPPNIPEDRRSPLHRDRSLTSLSGLCLELQIWWPCEAVGEIFGKFKVVTLFSSGICAYTGLVHTQDLLALCS
jgi:hypothetical protein